jgi:putative ABC transport system substrate-binding protein
MVRRRDFIAVLGGAAAWPLAARAQRPLPVIGYLTALAQNAINEHFAAAFRDGLSEYGYIERQNVEILYRSADYRYDRLPELAADFVGRRVAAIVTRGGPAALAAKAATATIPIVFALGEDPVTLGLVPRLNRPGGNITGITFRIEELTAKRLELLHEIVPTAPSIGFLVYPTSPIAETQIRDAEAAARRFGVTLMVLDTKNTADIGQALAHLAAQRVRAFMPAADQFFDIVQSAQIAALAARYSLATIYPNRENVETGGLMSYGPSLPDAFRIAGTYVGRILKGEKPADLPVQQSTRIEMVLNLKTAKALGIEVPTVTLLRADDVIE